jgi:glycosyl transferase family 25
MKKRKYNQIISVCPESLELENKIIISSKDKNIIVQCLIFLKFIDSIKIKYNNTTYSYDDIPMEGILFSGEIYQNNWIEIVVKPIDYCSRIIFKNIKNINLNNLYKNNMMVKIAWDNIYIINLARRTDRKNEMIKKLEQANITKYEFIEAYDGINVNIVNEFEELKKNTQFKIITSGHYACLLSHLKAIKKAKMNNYQNIMILEDDVIFSDNFLEKLNIQVCKYDMIYLGGIIDKKKIFLNNWNNYNCIMGAYGYILNKSLYDIIIESLEKDKYYIDLYFIKNIQKNYRTVLLDDLIKTDLKTSDTSAKSKKIIKRLNYI